MDNAQLKALRQKLRVELKITQQKINEYTEL